MRELALVDCQFPIARMRVELAMWRRVAIWAGTGLLVACGWIVYAFLNLRDYELPLSSTESVLWTLARITCPILNTGVRYYWVFPANLFSYALLGGVFEILCRKSNESK